MPPLQETFPCTGKIVHVVADKCVAFMESKPGICDVFVPKKVWPKGGLKIGDIVEASLIAHHHGQNSWKAVHVDFPNSKGKAPAQNSPPAMEEDEAEPRQFQGKVVNIIPRGAFMEAGHGGASDVFVPRNLFEGVVGVRVGTALDVMAERSNKNVSCKWIATTLFSVDGLDELKYENNVRLTGRVTNVTEFNAFIESSPGVSDIYVSKSVWGRAELEIGEIRTVIVERHESGQNKWRALSVVDETPTEPEWAEWDGEEQDGFTLVRGKKGNFLVQKPVRVGVLHDDAVEDNSTSASKESFPPYWQSPFPPEAGAYDSAEDIEAGSYVRRGHQGVNMSQIGTKASDEYMRETLASAMDSRIFETRFFAEVNNEQAPGGCDNMRGVQYGAASGSSGQVVMYSANIGQSSAVKEASEEHVRRYILPGGGVTAGGDDDREEDYVTAMNRAHACVYEGDEEDVCKSALKQLGIEPDDECVVCMLGTKEHCLLPCGHKALCIRCADLASFVNEKTRPFKTCPVCRSELQAPWVIPAEMAEKLRVYEC